MLEDVCCSGSSLSTPRTPISIYGSCGMHFIIASSLCYSYTLNMKKLIADIHVNASLGNLLQKIITEFKLDYVYSSYGDFSQYKLSQEGLNILEELKKFCVDPETQINKRYVLNIN